jgi:hypothetical protein
VKAGKRRPGFAKLRRGEHVAAVQKLKPARQEPHPTEIFELHLNQVFELKIAVRLATVRLGGEMAEWLKAHAWKMENTFLHISSHIFQPCIY